MICETEKRCVEQPARSRHGQKANFAMKQANEKRKGREREGEREDLGENMA